MITNTEKIVEEYNKGAKQNGEFVNELIYRPLAFPLVMLAKKLNMTPNQISVIGFIITILSGVFIATGLFFWGGIMLLVGHVLDNLDGSLARNLKKFSKIGAYFDAVCDVLGFVFVIIGLMIAEFDTRGAYVFVYGIALGLSLGLQVLAYDNFRARYVMELDTYNNNKFEMFCFPEEHEARKQRKKDLNPFKTIINYITKFHQAIAPIPKLNIPAQLSSEKKLKIKTEYQKIYKQTFSVMHKLWSFVGGSVIKTFCIVVMVIGKANLIWFGMIIVLNGILLVLIIIQNILTYVFRLRVRDLFGMNVTSMFNPFTGKPIKI